MSCCPANALYLRPTAHRFVIVLSTSYTGFLSILYLVVLTILLTNRAYTHPSTEGDMHMLFQVMWGGTVGMCGLTTWMSGWSAVAYWRIWGRKIN